MSGYRTVRLRTDDKRRGDTLFLHRLLAQAFVPNPDNCTIVDHIDRDTSNSSLSNLRWVTPAQSLQNRGRYKQSSARRPLTHVYKGVWKKGKRWQAHIGHRGKKLHIGVFDTELEAAQAYDRKSILLHGEHGVRNFEDGAMATAAVGPVSV